MSHVMIPDVSNAQQATRIATDVSRDMEDITMEHVSHASKLSARSANIITTSVKLAVQAMVHPMANA